MKLNTNATVEKVLWTGLHRVKVIAFNPPIEWLVEKGLRKNADKPVSYDFEFSNFSGKKAVFYLQSIEKENDQIVPIEFLISSEGKVAQNGKNFWVDGKGTSFYSAEKEESEYLDQNSVIHGNNELLLLIKFLRTWSKLDNKEVLEDSNDQPMDLTTLLNGNFLEIEKFLNYTQQYSRENSETVIGLKVLLGVNDKGYLTTYKQAFTKIDTIRVDYILNNLKDSYKAFKADYQGSLAIKKYVPSLEVKDEVEPDAEDFPAPTGGDELY